MDSEEVLELSRLSMTKGLTDTAKIYTFIGRLFQSRSVLFPRLVALAMVCEHFVL